MIVFARKFIVKLFSFRLIIQKKCHVSYVCIFKFISRSIQSLRDKIYTEIPRKYWINCSDHVTKYFIEAFAVVLQSLPFNMLEVVDQIVDLSAVIALSYGSFVKVEELFRPLFNDA